MRTWNWYSTFQTGIKKFALFFSKTEHFTWTLFCLYVDSRWCPCTYQGWIHFINVYTLMTLWFCIHFSCKTIFWFALSSPISHVELKCRSMKSLSLSLSLNSSLRVRGDHCVEDCIYCSAIVHSFTVCIFNQSDACILATSANYNHCFYVNRKYPNCYLACKRYNLYFLIIKTEDPPSFVS